MWPSLHHYLPSFILFLLFPNVEFSFFYDSAGEVRPRKNNGLPPLQGSPISAVMVLATQASIQNGICSPVVVKMSLLASTSPVPTWMKADWLERCDPRRVGWCWLSRSSWVALAKRAQPFTQVFWGATAYRRYHPLLFLDVKTEAVPSLHTHSMVFTWHRRQSCHKHAPDLFYSNLYDFLPTKRASF